MSREFEGKVILLTEADKGIGKVLARKFAEQGAELILSFVQSSEAAEQLRAAIEALDGKATVIQSPLAGERDVQRLFQEIRQRHPRLDVLVNNASPDEIALSGKLAEQMIDSTANSNLKGVLWCSQEASSLMSTEGGVIVNVLTLGTHNYLALDLSKSAVEALTRFLAAEYAPMNIRVNGVIGGLVSGKSNGHAAQSDQNADALADLVLFLASRLSRWITGQTITADGGLALGKQLSIPAEPASAPAEQTIQQEESAQPAPTINLPEIEDTEDIAIVGMGMVVVGANNPEEFWQVRLKGGDLFTDMLDPKDFVWPMWQFFYAPDPHTDDKSYQSVAPLKRDFVPSPALLESLSQDISQYELTTLWLRHSLLDAFNGVKRRDADRMGFLVGYAPGGNRDHEESTVLAGMSHFIRVALEQVGVTQAEKDAFYQEASEALQKRFSRTNSSPAEFLPGRIGRNTIQGILPDNTEIVMVDTACSSSLYSMDIGIKGLLEGKYDVAICGGAFGTSPAGSVLFSKLGGLSKKGQIRSLDKDADGVLFADGAGLVVCKTLKRAVEDGDQILAVIKGIGTSSDGKGKAIYAPNPIGQDMAIKRVHSHPAIDRTAVDWVTAHATGTPAGDRAEFQSLSDMLGMDHPVYVTANKALVGHTGWAAGVVSLIEVVLGLQKQTIPPQHNFSQPPADFKIETTNLKIPKTPQKWIRNQKPRTAAVSSFGFGGTNAHLIVEEFDPRVKRIKGPERAYQERIAIVGWAGHFPSSPSREDLIAWIKGPGKAPAESFGEFYPKPPFDKVRMPPEPIRATDRTQLMMVECAHQLREQMPQFWDQSREKIGVFAGSIGIARHLFLYVNRVYIDTVQHVLSTEPALSQSPLLAPVMDGVQKEIKRLISAPIEDSEPGTMPNVIAARVAHQLDLKGATMTIDTGFSSALTAISVASKYLRSRDLDVAIVGGVNGNSTVEMSQLLHDLAPEDRRLPAEGVVLFALTRESTAQAAGLPILGYLDDFEQVAQAPADAPIIECGPMKADTGYNYFGAEGALALLKALHTHGRHGEMAIVCHNGHTDPDSHIRYFAAEAEAAPTPDGFRNDNEYGPGKPLGLKRQVVTLEPLPLKLARDAMAFLPPQTLLLTDQPALLGQFDDVPADLIVISTAPLAETSGTCFYLREISMQTVEALWSRLEGHPVQHLRILTDLIASAAPETCLWEPPARLIALHTLVFLTLKHFNQSASFVGLFLKAILAEHSLHPFAGLFAGMLKIASHELIESAVYGVFSDTEDLQIGLRQAEDESRTNHPYAAIFYENGVRKTQFMQEQSAPLTSLDAINSESVIVATGGARGITAEVLKALAKYFQPTLYLLGSNRLDEYPTSMFGGSDEAFAAQRPAFIREQKAQHSQKSIAQINKDFDRIVNARASYRNIAEMKEYCGADKVHYVVCDVRDRQAVTTAIQEILSKAGKVDLVLNSAGLSRSASIANKQLDDFLAVRDVKVQGYQNLKYAFLSTPPRLWCNFGSMLGIIGTAGEIDYASGNDFLNSAADFSNHLLHEAEFTMCWSLWAGVGIGATPIAKTYFERGAKYTNMATEEGIHHFIRELNAASHPSCICFLGTAEWALIETYMPHIEQPERSARTADFFLGRLLSQNDKQIVFARIFDLEHDSYLSHHVANGQPTLPGTFVLEIAAEAALALVPGLRVTAFEDVTFDQFLKVYPGKQVTKKIRADLLDQNDKQARVQVKVLTDVISPTGVVLHKDKTHFSLTVILSKAYAAAPQFKPWPAEPESAVPDPYYMPNAPVHLTGMFASTSNARLHSMGKRATYTLALPPNDPVFSRFMVPSLLIDGLLRVAVLGFVQEDYIPVIVPVSIRRINLYEATNDCKLAQDYGNLELYMSSAANAEGEQGVLSAVTNDGKVSVEIRGMIGKEIGYMDRRTHEFVSVDKVKQPAS